MEYRKGILIQARLSSSRLPNKMLREIAGIPLVEYVVRRCSLSKRADLIAVITSNEPSDDLLHQFCEKKGITVFRGSLDNVLKRYVQAATFFRLGLVCRVCGDSPFVDVNQIDNIFDHATTHQCSYISLKNVIDGFISEVFSSSLLQRINKLDIGEENREHVTLYVRNNPEKFNIHLIDLGMQEIAKKISLTVDTIEDLRLCNRIAMELTGRGISEDFDFRSSDVIEIANKVLGDR
jgi:spore coat polysaccharide biosynthesis protein SpsF (cytidylyltransferase family)